MLNAVYYKDVAVIQSAVRVKLVSMVNVVRHVNVVRMHCAMLSIIDRFALARSVTQVMQSLAAHHHRIHVIRIRAELMLSAN